MGDHRADVKIKFTIHGKTYEMDSYINWFDDGDGVDRRVTEFFRASWEDAKARYDAHLDALYAREHAAEIEAAERRQLAELQAKYAEPPTR
jgi:hypothetical protein